MSLRHRSPKWLWGAVGILAALYALYWGYRLLVSRLGAVAPLVVSLLAAPVVFAHAGVVADTARIQFVRPEMGRMPSASRSSLMVRQS